MNLTFSSFGRFHYHHYIKELDDKLSINLITSSKVLFDAKTSSKKILLPLEKIRLICSVIDEALKTRGASTIYLNILYDIIAAHILPRKIDIFMGITDSCLISMRKAKRHGALTLLDRGSLHISEVKEVFSQLRLSGFNAPRISPALINRCLAEYAEADQIILPSRYARDTFIKHGVSPEKLVVIPYPVTCPTMTLPGNGGIDVCVVGTLTLEKGAHLLSEIATKLYQNGIRLHHYGLATVAMKKQAGLLPDSHIIFHGKLSGSALIEKISEHRILLHPSFIDGLSMVIPESLSLQLRVVCSAASGGGEYISDGINGFVVRSNDPKEYVQRILDLYYLDNSQSPSKRPHVLSGQEYVESLLASIR